MLNNSVLPCIGLLFSFSTASYSMEELDTEDLDGVSFVTASSHDESLLIFEKTIKLKILLKYSDLLTSNEMEPIKGDINFKILILPSGALNKVEFISNDVKEETKNKIIKLINMASPFNALPNKIAKSTDIFELIYTFNFKE